MEKLLKIKILFVKGFLSPDENPLQKFYEFLMSDRVCEWLQKQANKKLESRENAPDHLKKHWKSIAYAPSKKALVSYLWYFPGGKCGDE